MRWAVVFLATVLVLGIVSIGVRYAMTRTIEHHRLTTRDGVTIAADFYPVPSPRGWILFLHMMPATKESWAAFAGDLQDAGYASVAIDFRGHGQSEGGPDGYAQFTETQHQASIHDVEAAWTFLQSKGAVASSTAVVGASIGANLALQFLADHPDINKGVLLSAGLDYHGVTVESSARRIHSPQELVLVTSKDDGTDARENQQLYDILPRTMNKNLIIFDQGGHGTSLLSVQGEIDLPAAIKKFLLYGSVE